MAIRNAVLAAALAVGVLASGGGAWGQSQTHSRSQSTSAPQRLTNLAAAVAVLMQQVTVLQAANTALASQVQGQASAIAALQAGLAAEVADRKAYADSVGASTLAGAKSYADTVGAEVDAVADLLHRFSRVGNDVYITGANLHIRNGRGHTYASGVNGLGNLVMGYNELRTGSGAVNDRTGSHNVVLGFNNNYSSAGAILAGAVNSGDGYFASVLGGTGNTASGLYAFVGGGYDNTASGNWAAILGGSGNVASSTLERVP
jgi:hypothetical protein